MNRSSQVESLFFAALEKAAVAERAAFLESACAGDAELRRQVEKLLRAHPKVGDFLKKPALEQSVSAPASPAATQELDPSTNGESAGTTPRREPAAPLTAGKESGNDEDDRLDFLEASSRPDSLGRLGHYEALAVLGKGGFGIVFHAFDDVLQRVVAVKVMAPQLAITSPARKRFLREARAAAQVRHENIVHVYAVEEKPLPYLVMEFIPGETLQQRLDRVGPLEVPEVLRIGRQIAEGLAAAHATDLIHRDIKPANVLIEIGAQERVKITDFGLARAADDASLTGSGVVAGTPMYMSPEQANGHSFDLRADLFSLGSVLYVMATGRPPFRARTALAVMRRVAEDQPRPIREVIPEVPEWLCGIVGKLHAKDPAARFQSAREVADLLGDCEAKVKAQQEVKTLFPIPAAKRDAGRGTRGEKTLLVAAAVLLALLALAAAEFSGVTHWFRGQQPVPDPSQFGDGPKSPLQAAATETPPLAMAPFDAAKAKVHQEAWANHLRVPVETASKIGMKLMLIPASGPALQKAYYLGKFEVTQGEWAQVMEDNPSLFGPKHPKLAGLDTSQFPVEQVSWFDSVEFCNKLSERDGVPPFYELAVTKRQGKAIEEAAVNVVGGGGYHIPTHRQWLDACRAGASTKYHGGDQDEDLRACAWFEKNSEGRTHPVGEKKPNAFGLHDMLGNVWEWCANEVPADASDLNSPKGIQRMFRGGSLDAHSGFCDMGYHFMRVPSARVYSIGLRVARAP